MNRGINVFLFIIIVLLYPLQVFGAVDISANVDRTSISMNGQISLTLNINSDSRSIPDPKIPDINGLEIYSSGSSQGYNFINGKISSSVTYTYILVPTNTGKLTIPPFSVRVKGREYKTKPIAISVSAGGRQPSRQDNTRRQDRTQRGSDDEQKVFITAELDKKTAYVNEQVTLTFKFYQAIRLLGNPDLDPPSYSGFWVEDLPPQKKYYENIHGVRYYVNEIKTALFPTSPGNKEIEPFKITVTPDNISSFFGRDPFDILNDDFFGRRRNEPKILRTDKLNIEVKPLPLEGKPADFSGAVGKYSMQAMPDIVQTEVNQPINFTIRISGTGNIKSISRPLLDSPLEFRSYPSNTSERISKENYIVSGTRTFEEVLIPQSPGTFDLPSVELSYFDPTDRKYKKLNSKNYTIKVSPSSITESGNGVPIAVQDIGSAVKDLRYLKTELSGYSSKFVLYKSKVFWGTQLIPVMAIFAILIAKKRKDKLIDDVVFARRQRARAISKRVLKKAEKYLRNNDRAAFYTSVHDALTGFIADKLSLSAVGLTTDMIRDELGGKISQEILDETLGLLRTCDFHRFASVDDSGKDNREFLRRVEGNVLSLEKSL
ncbi:MAG: protein BatD [candidate division Zixibacteria bacterium]|nr:protein BatD [candidate division Zixibacteria bacterium]